MFEKWVLKEKRKPLTAHIDARITICANNIRESKIKLFILEKLSYVPYSHRTQIRVMKSTLDIDSAKSHR